MVGVLGITHGEATNTQYIYLNFRWRKEWRLTEPGFLVESGSNGWGNNNGYTVDSARQKSTHGMEQNDGVMVQGGSGGGLTPTRR